MFFDSVLSQGLTEARRGESRGAALPGLRQGARGGLSQCSGIAAQFAPSPNHIPYVASKHPNHEL
jgi:hypothetical protein